MQKKNSLESKILVDNIMRFKEGNNLTFEEMGKALNIDRAHIYKITKLINFPSFEFLISLARYMKVPLYSLFIPSQKVLREYYAELINTALEESHLDLSEFASKTKIDLKRLEDISTKAATPTLEELNELYEVLHIESEEAGIYTLEDKTWFFRDLLTCQDITTEDKRQILESVIG